MIEQLIQAVEKAKAEGILPEKYIGLMTVFLSAYLDARKKLGRSRSESLPLMATFLDLIQKQCRKPVEFQPFNRRVTEPFDYHKFGLDFWRGVVDFEESKLVGQQWLEQAVAQTQRGENVVFLANHQTEIDPQLINLLAEKDHPEFGAELIFVAGARVVTDPMAVPFSLGRNLLCIYSKRHIDNPPEERETKQQHNRRTMRVMQELLQEGGHAIYVAPSGGRDRKVDGEVRVADFDLQAVEMFRLMARKAGTPTHFYPLALSTYHLLAPPATVQEDLGEMRRTKGGPIFMGFGEELSTENFPGAESTDKRERREAFARYAQHQVESLYKQLPHLE